MAEILVEREYERTQREHEALLPPALLKRVSWGAIFAGAVVAVALMALLSLLGLGIGFDSFQIGEPVDDIPKVTALWWAVSSIIATGIGAFVAGRLAGIPNPLTALFHGAAVWAVSSLVALWLASSAIGFAFGLAGQAVKTTTNVAAGVVSTTGDIVAGAGGLAASAAPGDVGISRDRVRQEAVSIANQAGLTQQNVQQAQNAVAATARDMIRTPGDLGQDFNQLIDRLFQGPNAAITPAEQERLRTVISQRLGVSPEESRQIAERWQAQATTAWQNVEEGGATALNQVEGTATNAAGTALDAMADLAWYMFWSSLAGLVAALVGGALAGPTLAGAVPVRTDDDLR